MRGKTPLISLYFLTITMKLFFFIVLFQAVALYSANGQTQTGSDSVGAKRTQVVEKKKEHEAVRSKQQPASPVEDPTRRAGMQAEPAEAPLKGFIDENGDGVDDRLQNMKRANQNQMKHTMHDRFIDNDGDGINDERCGGMGIAPKKEEHDHGKHH